VGLRFGRRKNLIARPSNSKSGTFRQRFVPQIITLLQSKSDRIVVDKTGFNGLLDVHLEFSQDLGAVTPDAGVPAGVESGAPSIVAAIQELGLKLEPGKAPTEVLAIDRVQRPSEN
jgi:uncharacterized protein (TIGR03435 family)